MSEIKVNKISPKQTCTQLTLGDSGDTIIIPSGATIQNCGTATGFGRTGTVNWSSTVQTTGFTAVNGTGYFCNTTSGAFTVTLPATPTAGNIVAFKDYAKTWDTNNLTIGRNGSNIEGSAINSVQSTEGQSVTFIYVDSTKGWVIIDSAQTSELNQVLYVAATGGTVTTCGNYKIHTFNSSGCFVVSCAGNSAGSNSVDYMVVAGGGGGGSGDVSGGGGAGGFRESKATGAPWTASPLASSTSLPVTATTYPVTVGGGGNGGTTPSYSRGSSGSNSVFSTITATGGGGGAQGCSNPPLQAASNGGSGGGSNYSPASGGTGNSPPVSPPQGNPGGSGVENSPAYGAGGGGGATAAGSNGTTSIGGAGGAGATTSISGSSTAYAGGGGGARNDPGTLAPGGTGGGGAGGSSVTNASSGTTNRGGGGGGADQGSGGGGAGGSGIIIIRYKYQ